MKTAPTRQDNFADFRERLAALGDRVAGEHRRETLRRTLGDALVQGIRAAWVVPAGILAYRLATAWMGSTPPRPSPAALLAAVLAVPALWVLVRLAAALRNDGDEGPLLTRLDRALGNQDRLRTAREFLAKPRPTSFEAAAIEDAVPSLALAEALPLPPESAPPRNQRAIVRSAGLAVLAAALAFAVHAESSVRKAPADETTVVGQAPPPAGTGAPAPPPARAETLPDRAAPREPRPETPPRGAPRPREPRPAPDAPPVATDVKESRGRTQSGESADAAASSGEGDAKGTPSQSAQPGEPSVKKTGERKKPSEKDKPESLEAEARKEEEDSGATAGRGAATGSNRSPAASPWASKDQVTSEDEEALEEDEDVDDEFDNSDARGGVQPGLRDRKPPVNRDLSIGFGNEKNPDATGRGGPGDHKKSRGVASLVLGTPIPDHIKGKPNPGKTKITQERVQPEPEDAPPFEAEPRAPRTAPFGTLDKPDLLPWMRELIRDYTLDLRRKTPASE